MLLFLEHIRTVLKNLILPPADLLLLAGLGLWLLQRRARFGALLVAFGLVGLWLLSTPRVADQLTVWAQHYPALDPSKPGDAQAIVILGGGGYRRAAPEYGGGPTSEPYMLEKLAYGAYLSRRTSLPILVTGHLTEAIAMRDDLRRNFGIQPRWVEDQAYDTFENARNSARLLKADGITRIILLTRATHMWRSSQEFTATGLQVIPAPIGIESIGGENPFYYLPDGEAMLRSYIALYELLGDPVRQALAWTHLRRQ